LPSFSRQPLVRRGPFLLVFSSPSFFKSEAEQGAGRGLSRARGEPFRLLREDLQSQGLTRLTQNRPLGLPQFLAICEGLSSSWHRLKSGFVTRGTHFFAAFAYLQRWGIRHWWRVAEPGSRSFRPRKLIGKLPNGPPPPLGGGGPKRLVLPSLLALPLWTEGQHLCSGWGLV